MNFTLSDNELIVANYPYIKTTKTQKRKVEKETIVEEIITNEKEVVVTNKRVIFGEKSLDSFLQKDISLDKICGVEAKRSFKDTAFTGDIAKAKKQKAIGIVSCVLIVGIVLIFGIVMISKANKVLKAPEKHNTKSTMSLSFMGTENIYEIMKLNAGVERKETVGSEPVKQVPAYEITSIDVSFDDEVAKRMVENIGADILNAKSRIL